MAELFGRDIKTIGKHINNALKEELKDISVVAKFATTAQDLKTYQMEFYNLEMVTSVGYRVKSEHIPVLKRKLSCHFTWSLKTTLSVIAIKEPPLS